MKTLLQGRSEQMLIEDGGPFVVIGERINPSGRQGLAASLAEGDMSLVRRDAVAQLEAGAQVIDVNVSAAGVDEARVLPLAVEAVAEVVDVPICIDSTDLKGLAEALDRCPGRPLVNSVTGERASMDSVLPLVRGRQCAVIGLCMDERGIPKDASRRLEVAKRILEAVERFGIAPEDLIIDPLAMAVGADQEAAVATLEAVALIRSTLGVNTTLGGSNVSFGLPDRGLINRTFLAMAIATGLTSALLDPLDVEIQKTVTACELLMGRDEFAMEFLRRSRAGW
jgi:5-methyltetrahydrofolate--homocysteine methyltransferase